MKKISIIGCGFGGLNAANALHRPGIGLDITVFDKKNTFDFLPILPDCLGRNIGPHLLTCKIPDMQKTFGFKFINSEVTALDIEKKEVIAAGSKFYYDYVLIASGSETNFYNNNNIKEFSYSLDNSMDAERILSALKNKEFTNFVISGGGYTGIEAATNIRIFLNKNNRKGRVIIIEKGDSILGPLPEWIKSYTGENLKKLAIETFLGVSINKIEKGTLYVSDGKVIHEAMVIWAAGVKTAGFIQALKVEKNPQGRIKVDEYLRFNDVSYAVGDASYFAHKNGFLRMAVQFSISEGQIAASNIINSIKGCPLNKFKPRDIGYIIPMANNLSCGIVMGIKLKGRLPTLLHFIMCIYRSCSIKNKFGIIKELIKRRCSMNDLASLILRLSLGVMFLAHGIQLALGKLGGPGVEGFSKMLSGLGFSPPVFWSALAGYSILIGGAMLILGAFTRIACIPLVIFMLVAIVKAHLSKGFFLMNGGYEYNFIVICSLIALMILGSGKYGITNKF